MKDVAHNCETSPGPPLLVDIVDAARLLSVSRKTLWNNTAPRGARIPSVKVGERLVRYRPADLQRWVDSLTPEA